MERENSKKRKPMTSDEMIVDVEKIIRSTLVCSENISMVSGFESKYVSKAKGKDS